MPQCEIPYAVDYYLSHHPLALVHSYSLLVKVSYEDYPQMQAYAAGSGPTMYVEISKRLEGNV